MSSQKKTIESERLAFEKSLAADRYDVELRMVFADWLEENGYDDESLFQRMWTPERQQSEDWLCDYAKECNMSYGELVDAANTYLKTGEVYCLDVMTPDIVYEAAREFWERFAIATEQRVEQQHQGETFFRCGC